MICLSGEETGRRYQTGRHLAAFLLLLIAQRPDHGGSLIERLKALHPQGPAVDSGRVYRLLRGLEDDGALSSRWDQVGAGAPVRVYQLTAGGEQLLRVEAEEIRMRRDALDRFLRMLAAPREGGDPREREGGGER